MPGELTVLAAVIEASNAPLTPFIGRLIQHAPESFDDQRAGQLAATIRAMRAAGEVVTKETVIARHPDSLIFISTELENAWLPISAAESYAPDYWDAYQRRRAATIGDELIKGLNSSPGQARQIIAAARTALDAIASDSNTLAEKLEARLYSPTVKPTEPTSRYFIAGTGICTPDNLTTISAHAKAGKSAVKGAMIASTFAEAGADCLGFKSENPLGFAVVDLDTEQSPFDHWHVLEQARRRARAASVPPWVQSYRLAGLNSSDVWDAVRITVELAAKKFGGVHSVFVDGIADAAHDVNDSAEAGDLVAEIHRLAIELNCPIIAIIHVNPGSDTGKTRGHLGSQLERKSETNLRLEKDEAGVTVIWADKNRRAPIPKATAPRFSWCDQTGMHVSVESRQNSREAAEIQNLQIEADAVFAAAGKTAICYREFITFLENEVHVSKSTAKRRLVQMLRTGVITKELTGIYALTKK